jgi:hypothetical protein
VRATRGAAKVTEHLGNGQKHRDRSRANIGTGAAPLILGRAPHNTRADRIEIDIPAELNHVRIAIDEQGSVAGLEHVPDAPVAPIEVLRIVSIELAHHPGEVGLQRLSQCMVVVVHKDIGVHEYMEAFGRPCQQPEEVLPVEVITIDGLAVVAARREVIDSARELEA